MAGALDALDDLFGGLAAVSRFYEAEPAGSCGGPRFLNAAARVTTGAAPRELKFGEIRPLERRLGRVRTANRNAPRTIDIDIAIVDGLVVDEDDLQLPDPEIVARAHLALPLADVAPSLIHPTEGIPLRKIADRFRDDRGVALRGDLVWQRHQLSAIFSTP